MKALVLLVATILLLLGTAPVQGEQCRLLASFDLRTDWYGGVFIPVQARGRTLNMLIDTGGTTSMVTASTAAELGLRKIPIRDETVRMYGGAELRDFVVLDDMRISALTRAPTRFLVVPDERLPDELSGTLAPDFLSQYDVDLDFASARINLFVPCPARFSPSTSVPIDLDSSRHVIVPIVLDGRAFTAYLDTGASRSDLSLETAESLFGLSTKSPRMYPAQGPDVQDGIYRYPFRTLKIGSVAIDRPDVVLVPDSISRRRQGSPQMVLGMSILRHYRLTIGYYERRLSVAPLP